MGIGRAVVAELTRLAGLVERHTQTNIDLAAQNAILREENAKLRRIMGEHGMHPEVIRALIDEIEIRPPPGEGHGTKVQEGLQWLKDYLDLSEEEAAIRREKTK